MCKYCDIDSGDCEIFQSYPFTGNDWYLKVTTSRWDNYDEEWFYEKVYINYCPYCGRKLSV